MSRPVPRILVLMPGPKFDLAREFGVRLNGLSSFSCGYLLTAGTYTESMKIGEYQVISTQYEPQSTVSRLVSRLRYLKQCVATIVGEKRGNRPIDIVLTYDPLLTGFIGLSLARAVGARLVCEVNGEYAHAANFMHVRWPMIRELKRRLAAALVRFVLRRADGIRILFPDQLKDLGYRPRSAQVVAQIPEFVNTAEFRNLGEAPVVLIVGFPFFVKGIDIAVAAFKRIAGEFPEWKLKIIGHYPDMSELNSAIGHCESIVYHKPVLHREMNSHIGSCGIVLQCSRTEAMGRVLVEAMAAAKPRVASKVGGIPTVVSHGVDGLLVEPGDIEGFAEALSSLMRSAELRRRLGEAGRRRVMTEFTPERYFQDVGRLFERVLEVPDAAAAAENQ